MDASPSRMITLAEAAKILGVSEHAVREWIADGLIASETTPGGEPRIRLRYEHHVTEPGLRQGLVILDLHRGVSDGKRARFRDQLSARRREHELEGLEWTGVDVDALTALLAARLAEVVPDPQEVGAERGMVSVAGSGIDVALFVADGEGTVEERLIFAAEHVLDRASEAFAEVTCEPRGRRARARRPRV